MRTRERDLMSVSAELITSFRCFHTQKCFSLISKDIRYIETKVGFRLLSNLPITENRTADYVYREKKYTDTVAIGISKAASLLVECGVCTFPSGTGYSDIQVLSFPIGTSADAPTYAGEFLHRNLCESPFAKLFL